MGPQRTLCVTLHVGSGLFFEFEIENYDQLLWNAQANVKTNTRNPEHTKIGSGGSTWYIQVWTRSHDEVWAAYLFALPFGHMNK